jgi:hypothetical protein
MAFEYRILDLPGGLAGEDLSSTSSLSGYNSTGQFLLAKLIDTHVANTYVHCSATGDVAIGVIQNNPKSGAGVDVRVLGVSKVVAGATLVVGQFIGPDAYGRAVNKNETATGADYGDTVCGIVLEGAAVGELATVFLFGPRRV